MHSGNVCRRSFAGLVVCGAVLAGTIAGSPVAGAATAANQSYVRALYGDLLDRTDTAADSAGVNYWANQLATRSKLSVARSIQFATSEYFSKILDVDYALYLDRSPDPAGERYLVQAWKSRRFSYERVVAIIVGSNEYFRRAGGSNVGFVNKAYADILGSQPSSSAREYFRGIAASQGRERVAVLLEKSHQALTAFVEFQYNSLLGRNVDPGSRTFWVDRLANGFPREGFDVTIVSSAEYYGNNS